MFKSIIVVFGVLMVSIPSFGMAPKKPDPVSMLVVPDQRNVIQIASELENRRPVILVSYESQPVEGLGMIHVWDRQTWIPISLDQFSSGRFLNVKPSSAMVVDDGSPLARQLIGGGQTWVPEVFSVNGLSPAELVNEFGQYVNFNESDYRFFAKKYGFNLRGGNSGKNSWYDQPYVDETKARGGAFHVMPGKKAPDFGRIESPKIAPPRSAEVLPAHVYQQAAPAYQAAPVFEPVGAGIQSGGNLLGQPVSRGNFEPVPAGSPFDPVAPQPSSRLPQPSSRLPQPSSMVPPMPSVSPNPSIPVEGQWREEASTLENFLK